MAATLYSLAQHNRTNKRKLFESVILIALVAAAGYAVTRALFFDTESSQQTSFSAGTLDMTVTGDGGQQLETLTVENFGADGVVSGGKTWTIQNVGSLDGYLDFGVENVVNSERGCVGPESAVDITCANPGDGLGELGSVIIGDVTLDDGAINQVVASTTLETVNSTQFEAQWDSNLGQYRLEAGESVDVTFAWRIANDTYDNTVQSDRVVFDVIFDLEQIVSP